MIIGTTRFGSLQIDDQKLLTFPRGLLGFPTCQRFALIEAGNDSHFYWLQSVDRADLAFVVTDPTQFVPTYKVPMKEEQLEELGICSFEEARVFVIVNKRGNLLTGNLQGPILVNVMNRQAEQLVLSDRRFTTRVPLLELPMREAVAA